MPAIPKAPTFVLGLGLGGFVDGIVMHQILQRHHLLTLMTVRAWQRRELAPPWRAHFGMLLAGWGVFNLVEGAIDNQPLGIHHVRDDLGGPIGWDLAFLALGVLLIAGGLALARSGERTAAA